MALIGSSLTSGAASPFGSTVGHQISPISGFDETGTLQHLYHYFDHGNSYVLLSIDGAWCPPSNEQATQIPAVLAWAAANGVQVNDVTLLIQGLIPPPKGGPTTQGDALRWAHLYHLSNVLDDNGSWSSQVDVFGYNLATGPAGSAFPTTLILAPRRHTIVDQVQGFQTASQLEARITTAVNQGDDN
jgi:hypothetical protein